jgi:carnitine O-acetyltransferase
MLQVVGRSCVFKLIKHFVPRHHNRYRVSIDQISMNQLQNGTDKTTRLSSTSLGSFNSWTKGSVIESNGDYRDEAWIEDHVGGPLYNNQQSLPRLPVVASIDSTLQRFLPTALPLARTDDEARALLSAVEKFPQQAAHLQKRLEQRKEEFSNSSWLQLWWNQIGYLQVRDSIVINVSYFFHFLDDTTIFSEGDALDNTPPNVKRAASVITALAEYRQQVCSGRLPVEFTGKDNNQTFLCSSSFKYMFHTTRIPREFQDSVVLYDPSKYKHCIVARKGIFYSMDFCDDNGNPFSIDSLINGLHEIMMNADKVDQSTVKRLGYLTGINRDHAAVFRQALLDAGGHEMEAALEVLQSGAFVICLDDVSPVGREECSKMLLHGNSGDTAHAQGYNRWFDKSLQFVVANNGKTGLIGEHSMMDGMPMLGLSTHVTKKVFSSCLQNTGIQATCNVKEVFSESVLNKIETTTVRRLLHNGTNV